MVELLVVMGIITVITGVTLSSQSSFNKTIILSNTAYDIALTIRLAETYGVNSRDVVTAAASGYGLHFGNTSPASFDFFRDSSASASASTCHGLPSHGNPNAPNAKTGNCIYAASEKLSDHKLGNNITISDFCAASVSGTWSCKSGGGLTSLDIVFIRPDPVPSIYVNGDATPAGKRTKACLTISSADGGLSRFVTIGSSGLIAASATAGCPTL